MQVLKCAARGSLKIQDAKMKQKIAIWAPSHNFIGLYLHNWGMYRQSEKNLLSSNISSTCPHSMVNGLLAAEIVSGVWGTPATFNSFRVLAALLHGSQVVSVSQTLRRWTEGTTYVRQGDHHIGYLPTFLVNDKSQVSIMTCLRACHSVWIHTLVLCFFDKNISAWNSGEVS